MMIAVPFISAHEGLRLKAYQDVVGVYTVCSGQAYVSKDTVMTSDQCKAMTQKATILFMLKVASKINDPITPPILAAHTSFAYNVGINGYQRSKTLELTNAGKIADGCNAMLGWYQAGGKDCRVRSSGCYGVYARRIDEKNLCLTGAK